LAGGRQCGPKRKLAGGGERSDLGVRRATAVPSSKENEGSLVVDGEATALFVKRKKGAKRK